jgi:ELP3 family radical SAM enzyme/protein acetyltransferase
MTANQSSARHLFNLNFGNISSKDLEIIKKVNNPNVITTFNNPKLDCLDPERMNQYVGELVSFLEDFKKNSIGKPIDFKVLKRQSDKFTRTLDKKYKFPIKPSGAYIIKQLRQLFLEKKISPITLYSLQDLLTTKNRHHSGVLEIAIMTAPGEHSCKYNCYYCPNQKGIARSYIKEEPAVRRAAQNDFDCAKQISARISSYLSLGQPGDKGEFIILGGTFSNYSDEYRTEFMRDLYYACNTFYDEVKRSRLSLDMEKNANTTDLFKVIGITVETRPDCIDEAEILRYISYGVTRVQIGVQHTDDKLLKKINRQCYLKDTQRAILLLKKAGFKVLCHYMPNLPGATPEGDIEMFEHAIFDESIVCDEWKIYPTSVTTTSDKDIEDVHTEIEKWFIAGKYKPYSYEELERVIRHAKVNCPKYIRISRIFRDIPVDNIIGGADIPHMRQLIQKKMAADGEFCQCIRCREIKNRHIIINEVIFEVDTYEAQQGTEYFISANYYCPNEDKTFLVGFCRMRINHDGNGLEYLPVMRNGRAATIRELHVYGKMVPSYLSKILSSNTQHKGIGTRLMKRAEMIAKYHGKSRMVVISGVGVRGFYKNNLGYHLEDNYMVKEFWLDYIYDFIYNMFIISVCIILYFLLE